VATPTMTSGSSASNSRAYARKLSGLPAAHRVSIRTLRPGTQPNLSSPCKSAAMRACPSASLAAAEPRTSRHSHYVPEPAVSKRNKRA
jgi:hypothetical protein